MNLELIRKPHKYFSLNVSWSLNVFTSIKSRRKLIQVSPQISASDDFALTKIKWNKLSALHTAGVKCLLKNWETDLPLRQVLILSKNLFLIFWAIVRVSACPSQRDTWKDNSSVRYGYVATCPPHSSDDHPIVIPVLPPHLSHSRYCLRLEHPQRYDYLWRLPH